MPRAYSATTGSPSVASRLPTSAPSSPPEERSPQSSQDEPETNEFQNEEEQRMLKEEEDARIANHKAEEARRKKLALKRKKTKEETKEERELKAKQLDDLLSQSMKFSEILTKKTEVLGRVGSGFDGKALGEHDLTIAKQPQCMVGGKMRGYQLEGLTWMYEICSQAMSGILADEMGLGKTIQTISLIALLREQEGFHGPHLIVAPLSTLSNWIEEFEKWVPDIPVLLYHGDQTKRGELRSRYIFKNLENGRPTDKFPVVCTSYEMILRDSTYLSRINWQFIIIDEGHRMKNFDSRLFRELKTFTSATRLLITGTPLQNNLKELWSLLNFLMPYIFRSWDMFESWFDFSDLQDEQGTQEFIEDQKKHELVKKMHLILQPLLLRRVKADVEHMLPKKREYVLYAPLTEQQRELYNIISDKGADTRKYLEDKVLERLTDAAKPTPKKSKIAVEISTPVKSRPVKAEESDSEDDLPLQQLQREQHEREQRERERNTKASAGTRTPQNAFERMMAKKAPVPAPAKSAGKKRKANETLSSSSKKAVKSTPQATPTGSIRTRKARKSYKEADASDEDKLSDDEFEAKLAEEAADEAIDLKVPSVSKEEAAHLKNLELAKREVSTKKLGNPIMQLRLVCNSPLNFYNPWSTDSSLPFDESLITSSGKMLLLDRLLPSLFSRGHKVLIFSQFKTQLDILEDYASSLRKWRVCRIDGSVAQTDRRDQIKEFNTNPECKLFLLSTRAGGQGINLASADTVILYDSDWNPQQDLQAQDRAHRIGQTKPVVVFRLATKGTVEEDLLLNADAKRRLEKLVIKKGGFKSMGQKMERKEDADEDSLRSLLLKDGEVFEYSGKGEILSEEDLDVLCDRSEEAYRRAEEGLGNARGFKIVETKVGGLMEGMEKK